EIGTPALPVPDALPGLLQAELLRVDGGGAQLRDGGAHRFTSSRTWPSGSRKRIGRVGGERGAPGTAMKIALAPRSALRRASPRELTSRTCQWKRSFPRSSAG